MQKRQKWTCNCFRFPFFFSQHSCKSENSQRKTSKLVLLISAPMGLCAAFNAPAKMMHLCSSYNACLHASPQQRKVKSSVIVCVSFTHTRRLMKLFLLTKKKNRYEGWAMAGSSRRHRFRCMTKNRYCDSLVDEREHSRQSPHQFPLLRRALLRVVVAGVWTQLEGN